MVRQPGGRLKEIPSYDDDDGDDDDDDDDAAADDDDDSFGPVFYREG